jgi:hypothetical protein
MFNRRNVKRDGSQMWLDEENYNKELNHFL